MHTSTHPDLLHFTPLTSIMITGYLIMFAGVSVIWGTANLPGATLDSQWVLLTLAGAIVASSSAFLLNPAKEPPRIVVGRALFSGVVGVAGSRFVAHYVEWLKNMLSSDQIFIFLAGFGFGLLGFFIAYALVKTGFRRSQDIVDRGMDHFNIGADDPEELPEDIRKAGGKRQ